MVYIKKFKRNRPQNLRGVMRPRGHSFLEESLSHPRIRRTLMRALVGDPMSKHTQTRSSGKSARNVMCLESRLDLFGVG